MLTLSSEFYDVVHHTIVDTVCVAIVKHKHKTLYRVAFKVLGEGTAGIHKSHQKYPDACMQYNNMVNNLMSVGSAS